MPYSKDKLPKATVQVTKGQTVRAFLEALHENRLLEYEYKNQQLIISPFKPRSYTINGVLKDAETGEHIIGAAVQISGTTLGTITNGLTAIFRLPYLKIATKLIFRTLVIPPSVPRST